jgi:hypothetical protein
MTPREIFQELTEIWEELDKLADKVYQIATKYENDHLADGWDKYGGI